MNNVTPSSDPAVAPGEPARHPPFNEVSVLFPLLTLCTVAYLALLSAEFFLRGGLHVPALMLPVYITLLGAYAADKEIRRWVGTPEPQRKGALFVYLWVLLCLGMIIIGFFQTDLPLPADLGKVVLQVLGIFFGSRASKYVHERRRDDAEDEGAPAPEDPAELTQRQTRIMEHIQAKGSLTRAEAIALLGISHNAANRLLEAMQDQGLIRRVGEGRGTYYVAVKKGAPPSP